jgi:hypothetical protein
MDRRKVTTMSWKEDMARIDEILDKVDSGFYRPIHVASSQNRPPLETKPGIRVASGQEYLNESGRLYFTYARG